MDEINDAVENPLEAESDDSKPRGGFWAHWRLLVAGAYFVACVCFASTVSGWVSKWVGQYGWKPFNRIAAVVGILSAIVVAGLLVRKFRQRTWSFAGLGLIACTAFVLYLCSSTHVLLVSEYFHYPEFAGLYLILYWALGGRWGWALALSLLGGIFDETIQAFIPSRVMDLNDILLNVAGCLIGASLGWLLVSSREIGDEH